MAERKRAFHQGMAPKSPGEVTDWGGEGVQGRYFSLLDHASGREIVDLGDLIRPLLPQKPLKKVGSEAPHFCQVGFAVGGGRSEPKNQRLPARKQY